MGAIHCQTSAKQNTGVEEMFMALTNKMLEVSEEKEHQTSPLSRQNSQRRNVIIVDDEAASPASKSCCGS